MELREGQQLAEYSEYEDRMFETPFLEPASPVPSRETAEAVTETVATPWHLETPFETGESYEGGNGRFAVPEVSALSEIVADLKDHVFREALEELASEAMEANATQLAGEYGDRETRDASAERVLNEHFAPLAAHADSLLEQFFERLEGYEAEALTDTEIDRVIGELAPTGPPFTPAQEQFLGGLLRKAGKLVSGAVNLAKRGVQGAVQLAGKGLAAIGKLALGPLLNGLKAIARYLLQHVVRYAMGQLPPALRPIAQRLSDRLFSALGETYGSELEDHEQTETEAVPAGADVGRLEAEFDVMAAQLLLTPDATEVDHLVSSYGEGEAPDRSLSELDDARAGLARELQRLEAGESAQPVMEQFVPAVLWPAVKTAITIMGRPKVVDYIGGLLSGLIKPMIGDDAAGMLAPAIADAGLRIFGLETEAAEADPRALTAEALAATIEETVNRIAELPAETFENETVLEAAVREAFEDAAATYFPSTHIKAELRETDDRRGMWMRMPYGSPGKRYAKYSESVPVTITPRVAQGVRTFHGATLHDHIRDRMDVPAGAPLKTTVRLYQALPGATTSSIARAERVHPRDLHPLTAQAAGALLGPGAAGLGPRDGAATAPVLNPHRLHLRQRLYYIEPPSGRAGRLRVHARLARTEVSLNLRRGEIRLWFYLSEPLCQRISAELAKAGNAAGAFRLIRPLVSRAVEVVKSALLMRHLPSELRIVAEAPNLEHRVPSWFATVASQLGGRVGEWASHQIAQYLRNNAEQFRRIAAAREDGLTLCITMTRVPGLELLRGVAKGQPPRGLQGTAWLRGNPSFEIVALPGYAIR